VLNNESGSILSVQVPPTGEEIITGTSSGLVMQYDIRNLTRPVNKVDLSVLLATRLNGNKRAKAQPRPVSFCICPSIPNHVAIQLNTSTSILVNLDKQNIRVKSEQSANMLEHRLRSCFIRDKFCVGTYTNSIDLLDFGSPSAILRPNITVQTHARVTAVEAHPFSDYIVAGTTKNTLNIVGIS